MKRDLWLGFFSFLLTLLCLHTTTAFIPDDAYIHFRIAEHWAFSSGPYFNLSDKIASSSSPLWSALLCLLYSIVGDESFLHYLHLFLSICSGVSVYSLLSSTIRIPLVAQFAVFSLALFAACTRMESSLLLLTLICSYRQQLLGSPRRTIFLFSLATLIRYEMFIFLAVHVFFGWLRSEEKRKYLLGTIPYFCLPLLLHVTFAYMYFEQLVPLSIQAKSFIYSLTFPENILRLMHGFFLGTIIGRNTLLSFFFGLILIILLLWNIATLQLDYRREITFRTEWIFQVFVLSILYVIKGTLVFPWYYIHLCAPILFAFVQDWHLKRVSVKCLRLWLMLPVCCYALQTLIAIGGSSWSLLPGNPYDARTLELKSISSFLWSTKSQNLPVLVMAPEIGAIGEEWPDDLIDAVGIASSGSLQVRKESHVQRLENLSSVASVIEPVIKYYQPDIIIGFEIFFDKELLITPPVGYEFFKIKAFPSECRNQIVGNSPFAFGDLIVMQKSSFFKELQYINYRETYFRQQLRSCFKEM